MSADGGVTVLTFHGDTSRERCPPQRTLATCYTPEPQALNGDLGPTGVLWTGPETREVEQLLIHPLSG